MQQQDDKGPFSTSLSSRNGRGSCSVNENTDQLISKKKKSTNELR